ncbi:hypothetical protein [Brevibacterium aurantiacum]|uniref:hypothetical protein n=1 Tax=Brevibacterium aurantiacum TaxID=273384 RepID=UPI0013DECBEA|nr:hypothetical protein [Brevibacterium aurantiacum]
MHIVKGSTDPIIVSVDGTLEVTEAIHRGIQAGEIDEDGAFARFFGLCTALSPQSSANKAFEAHEGFWAFGGAETLRTLRGELGWFQIEHLGGVPPAMLVPLFVHAAADTVAQLGSLSISSFSIQIPGHVAPVDPVWIQTLLDQFAAVDGATEPTKATVNLFTTPRARLRDSAVENWFEATHTGGIMLRTLTDENSRATFDDRWALRSSPMVLRAVFDVPEWSAASASTLVAFMLEAARASKIDGPVIVNVGRSESA